MERVRADSIIRPDQQLLLRVTPPATVTFTPAPPSPTPTNTSTQPAPTQRQRRPRLWLDVSVTAEALDEPGNSGITVPLAIALCIAGVVGVGWVIRRWQDTGVGVMGRKNEVQCVGVQLSFSGEPMSIFDFQGVVTRVRRGKIDIG